MSPPSVSPTTSTTTTAGPPFNKATADAILRASDNVDFRVRRSILAEASCVFEDMLSIPQPPLGAANSDEVKDGLPIIRLSEDSTTLDRLLRLCYPTDDPQIDSLDDLRPVLQAALKYMMQESTSLLRRRLVKLGQAQPLRAFAMACTLELDQEAEDLAPLAHSVHGTFVKELRGLSAGVYYRIIHYLPRTGSKATSGRKPRVSAATISLPAEGSNHVAFLSDTSSPTSQHIPPELLGSPISDVIVRTSDRIDLHLHSAILSLTSPILADLIVGDNSEDSRRSLEPITLPEDSHTLTTLLRHIYPLPRPVPARSLNELKDLLSAAHKYRIVPATQSLRSQLCSFLPGPVDPDAKCERGIKDALRVFAVAQQYGFFEERMAAARTLLRLSSQEVRDRYVEELEDISAEAYFRLLEYHDKCGQAASAQVLAHALSCYSANSSSAPSSPVSSGMENTSAHVRASKRTNHTHPSPRPSAAWFFPGAWPGGAVTESYDPQALLITHHSHASTCHVLLDDTSSPAWARFRTHSTPRWWIMYLYKVALVLRHRPWARVALDPGLRQRAIARALECECCRGAFLPGFQEYAESLVREVERAVAKVVLEI
ncbi:hypothetical protein K466DRAFT_658987 [Polyporus arcularius HHB13444]|uniref:BTB domain-containing protein n=1 Tax=Polyporus arcularius HHB13444 TaxID=1314778 RepID=A0A5C3PWM1_9APHY|nr:hypothetical protein K466DRAFT_658987 [Polyporus arcularius HHB13444]